MKKNFLSEKRQRFSFRKLSVGLVSAAVGAFFLSPVLTETVAADTLENIHIKTVTEAELTEQEEQLVIHELPKLVEENDDTVYYVYRPDAKASLPATGETAVGSLLATAMGTVLLVAVYRKSKDGKAFFMGLAILSTAGSLFLAPSALAVTNVQLAAFNEEVQLAVGSDLPKPLDIAGYHYVGYFKTKKEKADTGLRPVLPNQEKDLSPTVSLWEPDQSKDLDWGKVPTPKPEEPSKPEPTPQLEVKEEVETKVLPFETVEVASTDLPLGQSQVLEEGAAGEEAITKRSYYLDGKLIKTEEVSRMVTKAASPRIVKVGTGTVQPTDPVTPPTDPSEDLTTSDETSTEAIAFESTTVESSNLPTGQSQVIQEGQTGERTIVTRTYKDKDGKVVKTEVVSSTVTKQPVNQVLLVGTGPAVQPEEPKKEMTTKDTEATEEVPYETETVLVKDLPKGERRVKTAGVKGVKTTVTRHYYLGDEEIKSQVISSTVTTAPINEVVEIGQPDEEVPPTAPVEEKETIEVTTKKESIDFKVIRVDDPELEEGKEVISVTGEEGERTITYINHMLNGTLVRQEELSNEVTKAPVDQVIKVGRKPKAAVDKTLLEATIAEAVAKIQSQYTEDSWTPMVAALTKGQAVDADSTVTQSQVDEATQKLRAALDALLKKEPEYTDVKVTKDEKARTVTLDYTLSNPGQSYVSSQVEVYDGDRLVKTVPIVNNKAVLTDLDYDIDYRLHTVITYDQGQGNRSKVSPKDQQVELVLKKIEVKDVDGIQLYKVENGKLEVVGSLSQAPSNLSNYYVKVQSDRYKDLWLPVTAVKETAKDGQNVYEMTAQIDELVHNNGGTSSYEDGFKFYISKKKEAEGNVYYNFKDLIAAMKANPSGDFVIGGDLDASEVANPGAAYLPGDFTGSLTGLHNGKQAAIFNLKAPLMETLKGTVKELDLKRVAISGGENVGALAKKIDAGTVDNVAVQGSIQATRNVGGLAYEITNGSTVTNVSFRGTISSPSNTGGSSRVGGIAGVLTSKSRLKNALVDADITVELGNSNDYAAGGVVANVNSGGAWGWNNASYIDNVHIKGSLTNKGQGERAAGVASSNWVYGQIHNVVTEMKVDNGFKVYGDTGAIVQSFIQNTLKNIVVTDQATGKDQSAMTFKQVDATEAKSRVDKMQITASLDDTSSTTLDDLNKHETDYSTLSKYQADKAQAYRNMEKLLPFYNKEILVKYGNKVAAGSSLAIKELLSVTPMQGDKVVSEEKGLSNRIMLHFADGTVEYMSITAGDDFTDGHVVEYKIAGTDLIYTLNQFDKNHTSLASQLAAKLAAVNLYGSDMQTALGASEEEQVKKMYWDKAYAKVQTALPQLAKQILVNAANISQLTPTMSAAILDKVDSHKAEIMAGLTYLARHYNINFDQMNIQDLTILYPDFFGKQDDVIDRLIEIGSAGKDALATKVNTALYDSKLAKDTGKSGILDFLDYNRKLFTNKDEYEWFADATKDHVLIEERQSKEAGLASKPYKAYDHLKHSAFRNYILPLLQLEDAQLYLISNVASLSFGSPDRMKKVEAAKYKELAARAADQERDWIDTYYRILPSGVRDKLAPEKAIASWDGYLVAQNWSWFDEYGKNTTNSDIAHGIIDFFGPIGKYYKSNGLGAYADQVSYIHFVVNDQIGDGDYGVSVWTHEMTHNLDRNVFLNGKGRREATGPEEFALGMFQNIPGKDQGKNYLFGLNFAFDLTDSVNKNFARTTNAKPDRFQNAADLQEFMKGMMDTLYSLDYLEAQSLMKQDKDEVRKWVNKLEQVADGVNSKDKVRAFTDEEWAAFDVTDFKSWISNGVLMKRGYGEKEVDRNTYETIQLFDGFYGAGENTTGTPGGMTFKRMAFELMASDGYENGFLKYASNELKDAAKAAGQAGLSDSFITSQITNGAYSSLTEYKKALFQERIDKIAGLKAVTVNGQTYSSLSDIQAAMDKAVAADIAAGNQAKGGQSQVRKLKAAIYMAYLKDTDDFRSSIFK